MIHHAQNYVLRIDGPLFRDQRRLLMNLAGGWTRGEAIVPQAGDAEQLEGLVTLLDEIADQAHDQHGIDCLLEDPGDMRPSSTEG